MEAEVSRAVRDLERLGPPGHVEQRWSPANRPYAGNRPEHQAVHRTGNAGEPGYTVPAPWLADLDAIPDGDAGEPESGYLVGIETPADPTLFDRCPPNRGRPGHADGGRDPRGRPAMTPSARAELAKELGLWPATAKTSIHGQGPKFIKVGRRVLPLVRRGRLVGPQHDAAN